MQATTTTLAGVPDNARLFPFAGLSALSPQFGYEMAVM
jgi:hypothetical protein